MAAKRSSAKSKAKSKSKSTKKKAASARAAPQDLRERAEAFRDSLVLGHHAPSKDGRQTALHDGWRIILKPRTSDLRRRANDLVKAKRWIYDEADVAIRLSGEEQNWSHVVRQVFAPIYARLGGALLQYHRLRLVWRKKVLVGTKAGSNAAVGSAKQIAAQKKSAKQAAAKAETQTKESYRETMDLVLGSWQEKRDLLGSQMKQLQVFVADLQALEEARIKDRLRHLESASAKERVREKLRAMRLLRLDARSFRSMDGYKAADYGRLLRKWLSARRTAANKTG